MHPGTMAQIFVIFVETEGIFCYQFGTDWVNLKRIGIMNKSTTFLCVVAIFCISVIFTGNARSFEIDIEGSPEYRKQVGQALNLLKNKAPNAYQIVKKYVGKILQNKRSGMAAFENPPTYKMSDRTAFYSLTWCAGTIAHDSYHSKLYHDYREKKGEPVPYEIWAGFEAEKKCIKHQMETLMLIEAPLHEINHCTSLDGTHGDTNKDGVLDFRDYELRDW